MSHKSSYSLIELKIKDQKWCIKITKSISSQKYTKILFKVNTHKIIIKVIKNIYLKKFD